jgi:hypothetical protein
MLRSHHVLAIMKARTMINDQGFAQFIVSLLLFHVHPVPRIASVDISDSRYSLIFPAYHVHDGR